MTGPGTSAKTRRRNGAVVKSAFIFVSRKKQKLRNPLARKFNLAPERLRLIL
jgi:hypothetical protein